MLGYSLATVAAGAIVVVVIVVAAAGVVGVDATVDIGVVAAIVVCSGVHI